MGGWNLIYNVHYEVASLIFTLCLAAYVGLQYNLKTERNKQFYIMVWIVIAATLFDVITAITNGNTDKVPLSVNTILNTIYFWIDGILAYQFVNYSATFIGFSEGRKKRTKVATTIAIVLYTVLLIINIFAEFIFSFRDNVYQHEKLYALIYIVPYSLFLTAWAIMLVGCFKKGFKEKVSAVLYILFSMTGMVLQLAFFPTVLLNLFTIALSTVIVLFFLESNDYVAMSKMLEENIEMNETTSLALETKNRFLMNISDNIATPIKEVIDRVETIASKDSEAELYKTEVEDIAELCVGILKKMDEAVEYTALEIDKVKLLEEKYKVQHLIDTSVMGISRTAREKGIEIDVQIVDVSEELIGDRARITQVLSKLLDNAVRYTNEGKITVRVLSSVVNSEEVILTISVEDTGIGIEPEQQEMMFKAFERGSQSRVLTGAGIGLGLAYAKNMTEHMGGKIGMYSKVGEGTLVYMEIPQKRERTR